MGGPARPPPRGGFGEVPPERADSTGAKADGAKPPGVVRRMSMWKEFRDFIARGSVMDLAVGVIIGAAFGKIVTTLVEGILMPPLGLVLGGVDFASLFYVLDSSKG